MNNSYVSSCTQFGFNLFARLGGAEGKNLFISPASIATALTMAWAGADGPTREAMARALQIQGRAPQDVSAASRELSRALRNPDPEVKLSIANSLWVRRDVRLKPEFTTLMWKEYGAKIETLDFGDPRAPAAINGWVKDATHGKIPTIIEKINPNDALFLVNAIYFKGKWQHVFDKARTKEGPFHLPGGRQKTVPLMEQSGDFKYFKSDKFQAVSLPYGGGRVSMDVFLPDPDSDLKSFLAGLSAESITLWLPQFHSMDGFIRLPRFKVEYAVSLNESLKALGMALAFEPGRADFGAMITPPPSAYISDVVHKSFAEVNEEGTEAAAATAVRIGLTSVRQPFRMVIDRPFFFLIRDQKTGAVLFMGAISDPQ